MVSMRLSAAVLLSLAAATAAATGAAPAATLIYGLFTPSCYKTYFDELRFTGERGHRGGRRPC
jgi:hypothetical protein